MTDIFSKKKRTEIMSSIRATETQLEIKFRKELWKAGFRYRKNAINYFDKPDILLKKYKAVIFYRFLFLAWMP
jgi:DNA mismatch endonuclease, patch repair protein